MRLPLHDVQAAIGARFTERHGFEIVRDYGDWAAEYAAVREAVGLADCSDAGRLRGSGPDIGQVLHGVVTNEVKHLPVGSGCLAVLLNDKGRARTLLVILRVDDGYHLETPPGLAEMSRDAIEYYIITEDAEIVDETAQWGQLTLQGPRAREVAASLGVEPPPLDRPEFSHVPVEFEGRTVHIVRRTRSGEDGYDLWAPVPALQPLWTRCLEETIKAGGRAVGARALEVLRIEAAIPQFGDDLDDTVIPLETGLMHAISENKGCYLGQEIIARIVNLSKPVRTFVGLYPESEARPGDKLVYGEKEVGRVTSVTMSPHEKRHIALGYVRTDLVARGITEVTINGAPAAIHRGPFYRSERAPVAVVPPSPTAGKLVSGLGL